MEKLKIQRTENGGKGRENGEKGRTLKIEVQILPETCPKAFITDFAILLAFIRLVKLC